MNSLITIFSNNILPILLTAGTGYLLGKRFPLEPKTISRLIFYLFSPSLIFKLLTENQLAHNDTIRIIVYAITCTLLSGIVGFLIGSVLKMDRKIIIALTLTTMFTNTGNFGLSLNDFAFGEEALAYASIYFVVSGLLVNTVGVFIASTGKTDAKTSFIRLFRYPAIYAVLIALIFNLFDLAMPLPIDRTITILSNAAIPGMLVLLGIQLRHITWNDNKLALSTASLLRMVVGPILALILSCLFGMHGAAKQAAVTEASMPTAVMTTALATEFDIHPAFVTTVVTATTLLSPFTLTPLIALLGG